MIKVNQKFEKTILGLPLVIAPVVTRKLIVQLFYAIMFKNFEKMSLYKKEIDLIKLYFIIDKFECRREPI